WATAPQHTRYSATKLESVGSPMDLFRRANRKRSESTSSTTARTACCVLRYSATAGAACFLNSRCQAPARFLCLPYPDQPLASARTYRDAAPRGAKVNG